MTNEEAIRELKAMYEHILPYMSIMETEAYEMAIKALEQSPCDACVSSEALINELKLGYFNNDLQEGKNDPCVIDAMIDWAIRTVKRQPSVTPSRPIEQQPRQGHWIEVTNGRGGHECDVCHYYAPSFQDGDEYLSAFCPNCGADMRESEDEE